MNVDTTIRPALTAKDALEQAGRAWVIDEFVKDWGALGLIHPEAIAAEVIEANGRWLVDGLTVENVLPYVVERQTVLFKLADAPAADQGGDPSFIVSAIRGAIHDMLRDQSKFWADHSHANVSPWTVQGRTAGEELRARVSQRGVTITLERAIQEWLARQ